MLISTRTLVALVFLCACSRASYALDEGSMAALDGSLPDSDPEVRGDIGDPGYVLAKDVLVQPSKLAADELPLAPQLDALLREEGSSSHGPQVLNAATQALEFAAAPLALVRDTTRSPQQSTVQLAIKWKGGKKTVCSGTLIRPDAVLTAAHCVFNAKRGGFAYAISAAPGVQGDDEPFGRISAQRSFAPNSYRKYDPTSEKYPYDYGVVRLKAPFASVATRTIGVGAAALDRPFVIRGYPSVEGTRYDATHMYESRDRIRMVLSDGTFYHRASTLGGISGAGIDDGSRVLGVHTAGGSNDNSGVVFSSTSAEVVRDWATQDL